MTRFAAPALLVVLAAASTASAEDKRAAILARAFAYDYSLKARAGDSLGIALVYKSGNAASEAAADALFKSFKALEGVKVQGLALGTVKLPYEGADKLKAAVTAQGIDVVLVCDGLDAEVTAVRDVCRALKVLSVAEKQSYLDVGLTLGVIETDGKMQILVNLGAAAQENISFSSELLKLAKVIR